MGRIISGIIDLIVVVAFAVVGRASHHESLDLVGIATTAWPFLVACVFAVVIIELGEGTGLRARSGLIMWLVTLIGGLGLRLLAGGTAAWPFMVVAALFLAAAFFGWRLVWRLVAHLRDHSPRR